MKSPPKDAQPHVDQGTSKEDQPQVDQILVQTQQQDMIVEPSVDQKQKESAKVEKKKEEVIIIEEGDKQINLQALDKESKVQNNIMSASDQTDDKDDEEQERINREENREESEESDNADECFSHGRCSRACARVDVFDWKAIPTCCITSQVVWE